MHKKYTTENTNGTRFGTLTVIDVYRVQTKNQPYTVFRCVCDCGTIREYRAHHLIDGNTLSCGCQSVPYMATKNTKHGKSHTKAYAAWSEMRRRTRSGPERKADWKNYGSRGITVCDRWSNSFDNFYTDMGEPPTPQHSLDRIDNDLGYSPDNCRWSTTREQSDNRRTSRTFTYEGKTLSLAEWSKEVGISYHALHLRITKLKWPIDKALTTPHRVLSKRG